jgi:hypothetical protein
MEQKKQEGLPEEKHGGNTPVTFPADAVEHQQSNGDVNTTPSGNYLKEEGLADYDEDAKNKSGDVEHESPADNARRSSEASGQRKDVSP